MGIIQMINIFKYGWTWDDFPKPKTRFPIQLLRLDRTSTTGNNKLIWEIGIWLNSLHLQSYSCMSNHVSDRIWKNIFRQSTETMRFSLLPICRMTTNRRFLRSSIISIIIGSLISQRGGGLCFKRDHLMRKVPTPRRLVNRSFPRKWSIWGICPFTVHSSTIQPLTTQSQSIMLFKYSQ